jgi:hypothetical protein
VFCSRVLPPPALVHTACTGTHVGRCRPILLQMQPGIHALAGGEKGSVLIWDIQRNCLLYDISAHDGKASRALQGTHLVEMCSTFPCNLYFPFDACAAMLHQYPGCSSAVQAAPLQTTQRHRLICHRAIAHVLIKGLPRQVSPSPELPCGHPVHYMCRCLTAPGRVTPAGC